MKSHILIPDKVIAPHDVNKRYFITCDVSLKESGVGSDCAIKVDYTHLAPSIKAHRLNTPEFWWLFESFKNRVLEPKSRSVTAILEVPADVKAIKGFMCLSGTFANGCWYRATRYTMNNIEECFVFDLASNLRTIKCQ